MNQMRFLEKLIICIMYFVALQSAESEPEPEVKPKKKTKKPPTPPPEESSSSSEEEVVEKKSKKKKKKSSSSSGLCVLICIDKALRDLASGTHFIAK